MSDIEWQGCEDWLTLWHALPSECRRVRQLRLFAVAACRRIAHRLVDPCACRAIEICERDADGWVEPAEYLGAYNEARQTAEWEAVQRMPALNWAAAHAAYWLCHPEWYKVGRVLDAAPTVDGYEAVIVAGLLAPDAPPDIHAHSMHSCRWNGVVTPRELGLIWQHPVFEQGEAAGRRAQADLLRDVYGNPFRPVAFDPSWRTDTAVSLARVMYESREFGAMPILADALQDAGCDNPDILNHCRDPRGHVRGCWAAGLVLGKS